MENNKPIVLVVEDTRMLQEIMVLTLEGDATVLTARSFNMARRLLKEHGKAIVGVTLDGNILQFEEDAGTKAFGRDLVFFIKKECGDIPIFASSGDEKINQELVSMGCQSTDKKSSGIALLKYIQSRKW